MTLARIAANLDPANELADFQAAARTLLTYGLVTDRYPQPGALALVRRFEEPLRNEFGRMCHWRLDVGPTSPGCCGARPCCHPAARPARPLRRGEPSVPRLMRSCASSWPHWRASAIRRP